MTLPVAHRAKLLSRAGAIVGALGMMTSCSMGGTQHVAATKSAAAASPSAPATDNPLAGPIEPASALPKTCSTILSDQDLTSAFGSPQVGDTSYGSFAPLPTIGRTGRVTCGFGIPVDQFGKAGQPVVTVSVITYDQASRAVSRVAGDVSGEVAKGATSQPVLVNGHPATLLVEPAAVPTAASATASASAAAGSGGTELLMADGNRTFVITLPPGNLSGTNAVSVLTNVAALVYQHTLPAGSPTATR